MLRHTNVVGQSPIQPRASHPARAADCATFKSGKRPHADHCSDIANDGFHEVLTDYPLRAARVCPTIFLLPKNRQARVRQMLGCCAGGVPRFPLRRNFRTTFFRCSDCTVGDEHAGYSRRPLSEGLGSTAPHGSTNLPARTQRAVAASLRLHDLADCRCRARNCFAKHSSIACAPDAPTARSCHSTSFRAGENRSVHRPARLFR